MYVAWWISFYVEHGYVVFNERSSESLSKTRTSDSNGPTLAGGVDHELYPVHDVRKKDYRVKLLKIPLQ